MKVYIAGKMTGIDLYNWPEFNRVAEQWRDNGHEVITPFDTNSIVWQRHYGHKFRPGIDKCEYDDPLLLEMFAEDVKAALAADALVLLDDWQNSSGARTEMVVGVLFKKPTYRADGRRMHVTMHLSFDVATMPEMAA